MKKAYLLFFTASIFMVVLGVVVGSLSQAKNKGPSKLDDFAKCLAEKKVTMYGAAWCPHCKNEKKAFGSSFQYVPYIECPANPQLCIEKGINGYPTWLFPDGKKLEGEQGLKKLSEESSCKLPDDY